MNPVRFLSTLLVIALFVASTKTLDERKDNKAPTEPNSEEEGLLEDENDEESFDEEEDEGGEDENEGPLAHNHQLPEAPAPGGVHSPPRKKSTVSHLSEDPPQHPPSTLPNPPEIPKGQVTAEASGTLLCGDKADPYAIVELHGIPENTHWNGHKPQVKSNLGVKGECIGFGTTDAKGNFHIAAQKPLKSKRSFEVYAYTHCVYETTLKVFPPGKVKKARWTPQTWLTRVYRLRGIHPEGENPPTVDVGTASVISHSKATRVNKITNGDATGNIIQRCYQMKEEKATKKKLNKKKSAPPKQAE